MGETRWASRVGMRAEGRGEGHFFFFWLLYFLRVFFYLFIYTGNLLCVVL